MITAGIDIGTNTVRMIVAEVKNLKIDSIIHQNRAVTRLGEGFIKTGLLSDEAIRRTADAVIKFYNEAIIHSPEKIKCCATSAVREAKNGSIFIDLLKSHNISIEIIDGEMEGKLTCMGVMSGLNIEDEPSLIVDIGGGSTELTFWNGKTLSFAKSYKIGVVKLADLYNFKDPCSDELLLEVKRYVSEFISDFDFSINLKNIIATAGTPTTLAAIDMQMEVYDYKKVNGYIISKVKLNKLIKLLSSKSFDERKNIKGLEAGREDLIIPGSLILDLLLEKFHKDSFIVSDFGLREGIAIAASL